MKCAEKLKNVPTAQEKNSTTENSDATENLKDFLLKQEEMLNRRSLNSRNNLELNQQTPKRKKPLRGLFFEISTDAIYDIHIRREITFSQPVSTSWRSEDRRCVWSNGCCAELIHNRRVRSSMSWGYNRRNSLFRRWHCRVK